MVFMNFGQKTLFFDQKLDDHFFNTFFYVLMPFLGQNDHFFD